MASPAANFIAGSYSIKFGAAAGVDLGVTLDGIRFRWNASSVPITIDRFGDTVVDRIWAGISDVQVSCSLVQMTVPIRNAAIAYFGALLVGRDTLNTGSLLSAGATATEGAQPLVLTPLIPKLTDGTTGFETYTFAKSFPLGALETLLSARRIRSFDLTWEIFPTLEDNVKEPDWLVVA